METVLILKEELAKFGFSKKEIRHTGQNQRLTLKNDGSMIIENLGVFKLSMKKNILQSFDNIQKIKHRPSVEPIMAFGGAGAVIYDNEISFHEMLQKDSPAIFTMNNLWLVVPEVQEHLSKFVPTSINNDLKYDEKGKNFYHDKKMKKEKGNFRVKDYVGGIYISAKYDKNLSQWIIT